jgi:hypothetical protein
VLWLSGSLASTLTEIAAILYVWTFGFMQSKFNYNEKVLFKFGIDLDVIFFSGIGFSLDFVRIIIPSSEISLFVFMYSLV